MNHVDPAMRVKRDKEALEVFRQHGYGHESVGQGERKGMLIPYVVLGAFGLLMIIAEVRDISGTSNMRRIGTKTTSTVVSLDGASVYNGIRGLSKYDTENRSETMSQQIRFRYEDRWGS